MFRFTMRFPLLVIALLPLLLAGCDDAGGQMPPGGGNQAVPVSVTTLQPETILRTETLPGRVSAFKTAEIRPQVSGVIQKRSFTEGGLVKKGQQLYQIDPALYRAAYDSALASLKQARANVQAVQSREERYAELVDINAVSKQEYDDITAQLAQAKAQVAVAEANVATAKVNLDYTKVYSPISGRIGTSSVTEGALVTAGQPEMLARVTQLDPVYVDMQQSSTELMRIRQENGNEENLPVMVKLEDGRIYAHEGELQFSEVTVDPSTGSVQLRAVVPNPEGVLLPGMFVQAQLKLAEEQALLVPQKAAIRDPQGNLMVWRVGADNTVNPTPIQATREYGAQWIVTSGVSAGDVIVTEGFQKIGPGAAVIPTDPSAAQEQQMIQQAGEEAAEAAEEGAAPAAMPGPGGAATAEQETQE